MSFSYYIIVEDAKIAKKLCTQGHLYSKVDAYCIKETLFPWNSAMLAALLCITRNEEIDYSIAKNIERVIGSFNSDLPLLYVVPDEIVEEVAQLNQKSVKKLAELWAKNDLALPGFCSDVEELTKALVELKTASSESKRTNKPVLIYVT